MGAARGVLEAAAAADEERMADPPVFGGRPRADLAGVRATVVDEEADAPVRSSVMELEVAASVAAADALLLVVEIPLLPTPTLADLPVPNDDEDRVTFAAFSLPTGG